MRINIVSTDQLIIANSTSHNSPGPSHSGQLMWDGGQQKFYVLGQFGERTTVEVPVISVAGSALLNSAVRWIEAKQLEQQKLDQLCLEYPNLDQSRKEFEIMHNMFKDRS